MTPAEWTRHVDGLDWQAEQETRRDISFAWLTATFSRAARIRPLADILDPPRVVELEPEEVDRRQRLMEEAARRMEQHKERKRRAREAAERG